MFSRSTKKVIKRGLSTTKYSESHCMSLVPMWWYGLVALSAFIVASKHHVYVPTIHTNNGINSGLYSYREISVRVNHTCKIALSEYASRLPWWALIAALIFAILVLPFYGAMIAICS